MTRTAALAAATILVLKMLPGFPLDGGRVLRSLLRRRSGELATATATAAGVGRGVGYVMVGLGALEFRSHKSSRPRSATDAPARSQRSPIVTRG